MPKPEHIEALARVLSPGAWDDDSDGLKSELRRVAYQAQANHVLAAIATDPAVQDAVLTALVEGGRLVEESANAPEWDECAGQSCHLGGLVLPDGDPWPTHSHGPARWVRKVRLVEPEWREATNE